MPSLTPCLWFDGTAAQAAAFYLSIFPNSSSPVDLTTGDEPLVVPFLLDGKPFMGLNGGPMYKFTEAVSFVIDCADQAEIDHYWTSLLADGGEEQMCGWLKDQFGVSWQVVPAELGGLLGDPDPERAGRVGQALMKMVKLDIAALRAARDG